MACHQHIHLLLHLMQLVGSLLLLLSEHQAQAECIPESTGIVVAPHIGDCKVCHAQWACHSKPWRRHDYTPFRPHICKVHHRRGCRLRQPGVGKRLIVWSSQAWRRWVVRLLRLRCVCFTKRLRLGKMRFHPLLASFTKRCAPLLESIP